MVLEQLLCHYRVKQTATVAGYRLVAWPFRARQTKRDIGLSPVCYGREGNIQPIEAYASSAT